MAFLDEKKVGFGDVLGETFLVAGRNVQPLALYFVAMSCVSFLLASLGQRQFGLFGNLVSFGSLLIFFVAQYVLFERMLRKEGGRIQQRNRRIFRFIGMAFVVAIAETFAFYALFVPALILGARWIMAPSFLVATDRGTFASLGESWNRSKGNTLALSLALLLLAVLTSAITSVFAGMSGVLVPAWSGLIIGTSFNWITLPFICMSVATYRLLNDEGDVLAEVFA